MLKMLWPFCMLKVPLCWWLVWWQVLVWTNKDLCVGGVQTLGGTPEPETHCAACPALHSPPWRHLHTNSASHYRHTTPSATPPPQVPPPPRYPVSSLAPSHVSYLFLVWMLFTSLNCFKHCLHFHTLLLIVFEESILPLWYIYLYLCFVTYLFSNRRRIGRNRPEIIFEGRKPLIRRSEVMSKWWRVL